MNCGPALANSSITSEDSSAETSKSMALRSDSDAAVPEARQRLGWMCHSAWSCWLVFLAALKILKGGSHVLVRLKIKATSCGPIHELLSHTPLASLPGLECHSG